MPHYLLQENGHKILLDPTGSGFAILLEDLPNDPVVFAGITTATTGVSTSVTQTANTTGAAQTTGVNPSITGAV